MNSQQLFWIYLVGGLVLLLFFLSGRKGSKAPTKLNLRASGSEPPQANNLESGSHSLKPSQTPPALPEASSKGKVQLLEPEAPHSPNNSASNQAKNLNVIFMYNGHDWDAYQVLGVPAGSSIPFITQKYQEALKEADPATFEFLEQAYIAILNSTKGRRL